MSNQNEEKTKKITFRLNSDSLKDLKRMAVEEETTQRELVQRFLDDGIREWKKSLGQSTFD